MRLSQIHSRYSRVRSARVALAAAAVAGLVVIAACTDYGHKSVTGPRTGPRTSSTSSNGFGNAGHVDLCVDKSSPVGDYTFTYSNQNNQAALPGNRFFDSGIWTDEGGDFHAFPPYGAGGPTNMPDGSVTNFASANVIHNDGITTACLRPLDRTQGSTAFETGQVLVDSWSGITIQATSNNANAVYSHTDCLLDIGALIPEHTIANPLSIPLWSAATVFAAGDLTRTDAFPAIPNHGDQIWRAKVGNSNVPPAEGATWSTADLGPCDTGNNPTRAFANVEHGVVVTFVFAPAPPQDVIPLFVIGDETDHDIGDVVYFWGSQWWKNNPMSLFHSKGWESFKGFAANVNRTPTNGAPCGTWTSRVGNSPPPPDVIPEFVGIIVTDNVIKIGPGEGGNIKEIIVVHSDGKYGPAPGHKGGGPVTEVLCPAP